MMLDWLMETDADVIRADGWGMDVDGLMDADAIRADDCDRRGCDSRRWPVMDDTSGMMLGGYLVGRDHRRPLYDTT